MADPRAPEHATAVVDELLKQSTAALHAFEADTAAFEAEQQDKQQALRQLVERDREAVTRATERLNELYRSARAIADNKARRDVLDGILRQTVAVYPDTTFDKVDAALTEQLKLARGITGAMRVPEIGKRLNQAAVHVAHLEDRANALEERLREATALAAADSPANVAFAKAKDRLRQDIDAFEAALPLSARRWEDAGWMDWRPPSSPDGVVRVGHYSAPMLDDVAVPALFDTRNDAGLVIEPGRLRTDAIEATQALMLRMLAAFPAGGVRVSVLDPQGLGESIAPLLPFAGAGSMIEGVFTREADIERQLDCLTERSESSLRRIDEPQVCDALVVFDHPINFTARSISLLRALTEAGARSGLFVVVVKDPKLGSHPRDARKLPALRTVKAVKDHFEVEAADAKWSLVFDPPPAADVLELVGHGLDHAPPTRPEPREPAAEEPEEPEDSTWWQGNSVDGLTATIGSTDTGTPLHVAFDRSTAVVLALGRARAGLTTFLHQTVLSLALRYSPTELQLSLFGLGSSRDFELYAQRKLPHARVVGLEVEPELAVTALDSAAAEIARRLVFFQAAGVPRDGYPGYRRETGNPLPRLVLAIDNVHELFARDEQLAQRARDSITQIALDGPDSGVHLLLSGHANGNTSTLLDSLPTSGLTCAMLPCDDGDALAVFGENIAELTLPQTAGEIVIATDAGAVTPGRVQPTEPADRASTLRELRSHGAGDRALREPQIVDGRVSATLEHAPLDQLRAHRDGQGPETLGVWLGESVTTARPVDAYFERRDGANLLVVTDDASVGRGLMISTLTTAALRTERDLELHVLDFTGLETGFGQAIMALEPLAAITLSRRRNLLEATEHVRNMVVNRAARPQDPAAACLFVVNGLHEAHDLAVGAGPDSAEARWLAHVEQIVHEGPLVGIHTVLWATDRSTLEQKLTRDALRRFALRVVGHMDPETSHALIDSPRAVSLRPTEALLYDEPRARLERFRPYRASDPDWIASTATSVINLTDDPGAPAPHA